MKSRNAKFAGLVRQFLGFAGISGLCWVLDFAILLILTLNFGFSALAGNIISSTIAAATAFSISARYVFKRGTGVLYGKLAFYLTYNLLMILAASWVMGRLVTLIGDWIAHGQAIVAAKIAITPVVMLSNFAVSKLTAERLRI